MAVKVSRSVKSERIWRFFVFLRLQSRQRLFQPIGNGTLAPYVQMAVDVCSHLDVRVAQPLPVSYTHLFKRATKLRYTRSNGTSRISFIIIADLNENVNRVLQKI